jgi:hypothetical protein
MPAVVFDVSFRPQYVGDLFSGCGATVGSASISGTVWTGDVSQGRVLVFGSRGRSCGRSAPDPMRAPGYCRSMANELLVLHALRIRGMASAAQVAIRFGLPSESAEEVLLDQQAFGRVTWQEFGSSSGWSLTARGKEYAERLLACELDAVGGRDRTRALYEEFLPLNERLREAITRWQLRPTADDAYAVNNHRDPVWDARVLAELHVLSRSLSPIVAAVVGQLSRFDGYDRRFARALSRAAEGDREWVDGVGIDSCHSVWFELHEDFLATLGLER